MDPTSGAAIVSPAPVAAAPRWLQTLRVATQLIDEARIRTRGEEPERPGADYVLYWMQKAQRARTNHALEHAARRANALGSPLVVGFGLMADYPSASLRHYRFMLEGLAQTAEQLARRGVAFTLRLGHPAEVCLELAKGAALVVMDRGYLRHERRWRERVAEAAPCRVEEVEADVVVPAELASSKREYAARTLRPKLEELRDAHLVSLSTTAVEAAPVELDGEPLDDLDALLERANVDRSVPPVTPFFEGGTTRAQARLRRFVDEDLARYEDDRLEPAGNRVSGLSPYLHFGQISPVEIGVAVRDAGGPGAGAFLEELVVRRELAVNYCLFEPDYDSFGALPSWCKETLREHAADERPRVYTARELERAETDDPYWNAAMNEMRYTGYLHNAMRMYWGKRILTWTNTPEHAFRVALELNDRYLLDGRDPSSYANVAWLFGLHDRPWQEREIFGKVRTMTAGGLDRKYDMDAYVEGVEEKIAKARAHGIELD